MEDCDCSVRIMEPHTSVDQAVVQNLVRSYLATLLHTFKEGEGPLQLLRVGDNSSLLAVVLSSDSFNQSTVSEVIGSDLISLHLGEE